jgi:hypothetical protein
MELAIVELGIIMDLDKRSSAVALERRGMTDHSADVGQVFFMSTDRFRDAFVQVGRRGGLGAVRSCHV